MLTQEMIGSTELKHFLNRMEDGVSSPIDKS